MVYNHTDRRDMLWHSLVCQSLLSSATLCKNDRDPYNQGVWYGSAYTLKAKLWPDIVQSEQSISEEL